MYELLDPTPEELKDMQEAHAEGLHIEDPREFCPDCEDAKAWVQADRDRRNVGGLFGIYNC